MSNDIIYNSPQEVVVKNIVGSAPTYKNIPVGIQALVNRPTLSGTIRKYLKARGFDWALWVPPKVARFPLGYKPPKTFEDSYYKSNDRYYALLDGDHRKHMFVLAFPAAVVMPVMIVDIVNERQYHQLFYEINFKNRKNASPDETFLHRYLSGEPSQVDLARALTYCGVGVQGSPEKGGTVGCLTGPLVPVGGFRNAMQLTENDEDAIKGAVDDINKTWNLQAGKDKIPRDLLGGFTLIRHLYPVIGTSSKLRAEWDGFLQTHARYGIADRSRGWKKAGGDVNNAQCESIALGLLKDFRSYNGGYITSKHKNKILPKARLERILSDKDKD